MKTKLYRPIGVKEYQLIKAADYSGFPPRLEWQPIFYPVMNQQYAEQIALDWNTKDEFSGYCGLVTAFEVNSDYLKQYPVQNVGGQSHDELWVPSEELEAFNEQIIGKIEIVNAFFGEAFEMDTLPELKNYYKKWK